MSLSVVGQRCVSEREPELGLGIVASVDRSRIAIRFPATGEQRLYATGTSVLKRVQFREGETVRSRDGRSLTIGRVEEQDGLLVYVGKDGRLREDEISDVTSISSPQERLMAGQVNEGEVFDLRYRTLRLQAKLRQSEVRGFLGGRLDLIPHQFYILQEVSSRQLPRVLLADEVGLGKTIEACLILQRLLTIGRAKRVLVLVPESLVHQWFVELLRRFNLWFTIYDEERCLELQRADPDGNPFLGAQLALCSVGFLAAEDTRREQAIAAAWDVVVVDEAHHLKWSPDSPSADYTLVEQLSQRAPGLLLLTATPTQLGLPGHFARLRLLDPDRYSSYEAFVAETAGFEQVAEVAEKIVEGKPLQPADDAALQRLFRKDPEGLRQHLAALHENLPGAREALLKTLLDQHGTGRVMFRNTRAAMSGFPKRVFAPAPLKSDNPALVARLGREREAEESEDAGAARYSFREDPRIDWLATFLRENPGEKVLLICRSQRKVLAIDAALKERMNPKVGLFHEGLPLVQRDRNAAWFAEPDGAQLLLCSEIGSEGRNFQFAHHLVLFDLPLNPGLVEQRIGRLDRIGQKHEIAIHVPYVVGSSDEAVVEWYHRGLNAFEAPLHGGNEYEERFKSLLLTLASEYGEGDADRVQLDALIAETAAFRAELELRMRKGRDRLLELNSFNRETAESVISRIRAADADASLRTLVMDLLDQFGVQVKEHEEGDLFLDPSRAYVESFPSIQAEGMLATFNRQRATIREDIRFLSADHPLVGDTIDLLVDSPAGTASFGLIESRQPNLLLEAIFVLEVMAEAQWHVDQFLAPTPVRVLVDLRGTNLTKQRDAASLASEVEDGSIRRFLEQPGFNGAALKAMVDGAKEIAEADSQTLKQSAQARAQAALSADIQRLVDLRRVNENVRPEEIDLARQRLELTQQAIAQARLRLDAIRLVLEGATSAFAE
ncbi:RNA polymerase-associated protein RapA [Opitutaceae bacterium EW11]|nr:RNA polymerase-associated protein RapA [Opitutaceae bacterium EW11]